MKKGKHIVFKWMRIIWPQIIYVEGIGTVCIYEDTKYPRRWARRFNGA